MFERGGVSLGRGFLRPIAHRGLHDAAEGIIENTAPAFEAAISRGFGIEGALRPASGGTPFVFHDSTLDRLIDADGPIAAREPAQLSRLCYRGQSTRIISYSDLLDLVAGNVPLLVEIKSDWDEPNPAFLSA